MTSAGGRLETLAQGPKSAESEAAAWDAFYLHMAKLGRPIEDPAPAAIAVGELADRYGDWMRREVDAGRMRPKTLEYYRRLIQRFLDVVGGKRPALSIPPIEVEMYKTGWHSVQAVQRLYNWGVEMGLVSHNPFAKVKKPDLGERERVLSPKETARLLRVSDRPFRSFLLAMRHTIARPQEIRAVRWIHLCSEPEPMFVLRDFKAKRRRKDKAAVRIIPLDDRMVRMLERMARARKPSPDEFVFLNRRGAPWTANAIRCRMRRIREKAGLGADESGEQVVAYTLRHTSATNACANGVRDRVLAELMGHTNTRTTQRYQHLQPAHLSQAIRQANRKLG